MKWYKKYKLLFYEFNMLVPLSNGEYYASYTLTIQCDYFWGLFSKIEEITKEITLFESIVDYEYHWDYLINNEKYFKL